MFLVDAHLDLAYSALNYGRNLHLPVADIRAAEPVPPRHGIATVSWPDLKLSGFGLVFGTLFVSTAVSPMTDPGGKFIYRTPADAHRLAMTELDYYHRLADTDPQIRLITDTARLDELIASHEPTASGEPLLGIFLSMEGADPIREPEEVELWVERGVRAIGLAWDNTRYAPGAWSGSGQGLPKEGFRLLDQMAEFHLIADISHLSERASYDVLEYYAGPVIASHSNGRALVPGERQLSDTQIRHLGEREGVIGVVLFNAFLKPNYHKGDAKQTVTLDHVIAHIDHICQLLGNATHVGIGSDLDGGFGAADIPAEIESVADVPLIAAKLHQKGYTAADIAGIMGQNWLRLVRQAL